MYRKKLLSILETLDARICDVYTAARKAALETPECAERIDGVLDAAGAARVLRREAQDETIRPVVALEVFARGGARILGHVEVLGVLQLDPSAYVVLVKRDDPYDPYVTARVYIHDDTGRDIREWDTGHYFSDLKAAQADFVKRAGL